MPKPTLFVIAEIDAALANGDILPEDAPDFWQFLHADQPTPDQDTTVALVPEVQNA